jgi:hypothetical protein
MVGLYSTAEKVILISLARVYVKKVIFNAMDSLMGNFIIPFIVQLQYVLTHKRKVYNINKKIHLSKTN